jgi:hypothetical protein
MVSNVQILFVAGDMIHRMMQLLEQNVTKHTAELHATTQERDHYKAKSKSLRVFFYCEHNVVYDAFQGIT